MGTRNPAVSAGFYQFHFVPTELEAGLASQLDVPKVIALAAKTDPDQPIEREYEITCSILEVPERLQRRVFITSKSGVVIRDLDIFGRMERKNLARPGCGVMRAAL